MKYVILLLLTSCTIKAETTQKKDEWVLIGEKGNCKIYRLHDREDGMADVYWSVCDSKYYSSSVSVVK